MSGVDITQLLIRARAGERVVVEELFPVVYQELRLMASRRKPRGGGDSNLETTALVHEAYLKLFDSTQLELQDRQHFFAVAAMAMRQIVVDHARRNGSLKRGGDLRRVDLDSQLMGTQDRSDEILAIDQALGRLADLDPRLVQVVELRFFVGLTEEEVAESIGRDIRTVRRDWRKARALLHGFLGGSAGA
jgi:RNA polymerase sigma factor (TIGR02999 family)